ncbi:MAG: hypothetical protein KGI67_05520 [Pseudomonadota bacterium]|nr:hypothetical protein [Pseudomonadota bacterium]
MEQLRIDNPRKRLYSMWVAFVTQMTELNAHPDMLMALVGHVAREAVDLASPHFKNCQGAQLLTGLTKTIDLFDFTLPMES